MWRAKLQSFLAGAIRWLNRPPDQSSTIKVLSNALADLSTRDNAERSKYMERVAELAEARQMAGVGPWNVSPAALVQTDRLIAQASERYGRPASAFPVRESGNAITAQGVYGDIELALQNVEWRREVNLSWLEFSRWGIQQLILICRLHYVKHPWIRRGINLSAAYVFGQGVELSSTDPDANEVLKSFVARNRVSLGQIALVEQEKRKSYDGNLFWCLFADKQDKGEVNVRLIEATEIQEVISDPDDAETPWFYRRVWSQRIFDVTTGQWENKAGQKWYPALGYEPDEKPATIGNYEVEWESPVYHRKVGGVANWAFGCPRVYPAIDWAKEGRKMLEACASVTQALSQIALTLTTKGGQQALVGAKEQLGTTVGPSSPLWDTNPAAVAGSTFASGPGTALTALKTRGAGTDPAEVKEYRNMAACALEIPPTWLGDMETSNLSTAQTLDRPTELCFLLKQEEWQEDLVVMGRFALAVSNGAPGGKLREAMLARKVEVLEIREAARKIDRGHWVYEAAKPKDGIIEVLCAFPAIREGDIPQLVEATFKAMAVDRLGVEHGIDQKTAFRQFCDLLGIANADELTEQHYPEATYERDRTKKPPQPDAPVGQAPAPKQTNESIRAAIRRLGAAIKLYEGDNGTGTHTH